MSGLVPLLMMWLWSQRGAPRALAPTAPTWPTAASPPPMPPAIPAFASQPPPAPVHPSANTGTPLADLHHAPPTPKPAAKIGPVAKVVKSVPAAALRATSRLALPGATQKSAAVTDLQTILISRGAKLQRDGLYGPKTANAWSTLARSKGLPPTISRVAPKVARVVAQTFDALSVPAIP